MFLFKTRNYITFIPEEHQSLGKNDTSAFSVSVPSFVCGIFRPYRFMVNMKIRFKMSIAFV